MYKIGVIGDRDSVLGFIAVGFTVYAAEDAKQAAVLLKQLASENYAIIYITENLAVDLQEEIDRYKEKTVPAVIVIPGKEGSTGFGMMNLKKSVERAVGADILFKE
ncbi:MAG: V-type ATP synthase subunit F [Clostridiales bacterium]|nr:V-type ATP synthase subunit F [Clostridiales bacterium]